MNLSLTDSWFRETEMKYIIDELEFWTEKKENKWLKASIAASQGLMVILVGMMIVWSVISFGQN